MNQFDYNPSIDQSKNNNLVSNSSVSAQDDQMTPRARRSSTVSSGGVRPQRCCAVCGDTPAKLHYGVSACFGCKGFFRRAVKEGRNKYVCRYEKSCVVDKYERNSCRYCRFRRCLQVGMNPDAVRPDRDQVTKQKLGRTKSKQILQQINSLKNEKMGDLADDDYLRSMSPQQRQLLQLILKIDSEIPKAAHQINSDSLNKFTLKSLINERTLFVAEQTKSDSNSMMQQSISDYSITALWRIVEVVDFINSLCRIALKVYPQGSITVEDKLAIVQNIFTRMIIFSLVTSAVKSGQNESVFLEVLKAEDDSLITPITEDIINQLKNLTASGTELCLLKAVIALDPKIKGIRPAASETLQELRNHYDDLLMRLIKRGAKMSQSSHSAYSKFANYLLVIPSLIHMSNCLSNRLQLKFPSDENTNIGKPHAEILKSLFNPDTTDYLRFPQANGNYFSGAQLSKNGQQLQQHSNLDSIKDNLDSTPPQIAINDQLRPFDNYHWPLSQFATAFSGLQVQTTGYQPMQTDRSPPAIASLVASLSPANFSCQSSQQNNSQVSPALPVQAFTSSDNAAAAAAVAAFYTTNSGPKMNQPTFYDAYPQIYQNGNIFTELPSSSVNSGTTSTMSTTHRPNTLDIPGQKYSPPIGVIPKLPLHLTKSIEEMLRPSIPDDGSTWNKPLAKDWADKVNTPAFNRDVVAKFFPECAFNTNMY